jgi:D-alanyl-D-alanine carboxypeptidase
MSRPPRWTAPITVAAALLLIPAAGQAATSDAAVQRGLEGLVKASGGPVGAVATLYRDGHTTVFSAGRANVNRPGAPRASYHMRIASIAKAFSGAIALRLVQDGNLGLDDTIGQRLPGLPAAWSAVTVRQLLNHTSGVPDYTESKGFATHVQKTPRAFLTPQGVLDWVRADKLLFTPGSKYRYSNTDNVVVGLIAEQVTGQPYGDLLSSTVFGPASLTQTSFPTRRLTLPAPFIHGYAVAPGQKPEDVTSLLSPSGAWASGGIVSTPADLGRFIRADLAGKFFGPVQQQEQRQFRPGSSSPPGPGTNAAGLALFRYTSRCGTVYGHTGNFPGYVQWAAATADGSRSVTTSLNIAAPEGKLLQQLRSVQASAVCALLGK